MKRWLVLAALAALGCGSDPVPGGTGPAGPVEDMTLSALAPELLLPSTTLTLSGSFGSVGAVDLRMEGALDGVPLSLRLPGTTIDAEHISVVWPGGRELGLADEGALFAAVHVEASGSVDGLEHRSNVIQLNLTLARQLSPELTSASSGVAFVNDEIMLGGSGFLLGNGEGQSLVRLSGCFTLQGQTGCSPVPSSDLVLATDPQSKRAAGSFRFAPRLTGIEPGSFAGEIKLLNRHADGAELESAGLPLALDLVPSTIFSFAPPSASLGQYVEISGGGFVGPDAGDPTPAVTTVELSGVFTPAGMSSGQPVAFAVVPEFESGRLVRYVLNEEDELGNIADLRRLTGSFSGTARPVVKYGNQELAGSDTPVTLGILPVKQVVWVRFLPSYVESLRHFGLFAVDQRIRKRVLAVAERDFKGANVEFRATQPEDFALYATVDVAGPDPNGLGLFGYDNTPGKDVGNVRLYDRIGGVNALTQEDGYPGYGGIFVESLFGFSQHPGAFAGELETSDPRFDQLFDAFRLDRGGAPVLAVELGSVAIPELDSGTGCPAPTGSRPVQIGCAVFTLGSLIGTTLSHEVAHSLGLADPLGDEFHNSGDQPNRLMDGGSARTFGERAEISGEGPGAFCRDDFDYLVSILPTAQADPLMSRPVCD